MFKGEIGLYMEAIGVKEGSDNILPLIALIAENFELEYFDFQDICCVYYKFIKSGVEFVFEGGCLSAVMFFITQ
jgi:hypothetical protein